MQLELHFEFQIQGNMQGIQTMTCCGCHNNLLEMPLLQNIIFDDLSNDPLASVSVELDGIALSILKIYLLSISIDYICHLNQYIYKYLDGNTVAPLECQTSIKGSSE